MLIAETWTEGPPKLRTEIGISTLVPDVAYRVAVGCVILPRSSELVVPEMP